MRVRDAAVSLAEKRFRYGAFFSCQRMEGGSLILQKLALKLYHFDHRLRFPISQFSRIPAPWSSKKTKKGESSDS